MKKSGNLHKKIFGTLLFFLLLALCLVFALRLTARKDSSVKYADFFAHAKEIDVLFLGSSHVINGVNPTELYENYGITSYNMGGHGSVLPETYWELMLALDYCTPQVVVIDTYMLEKDYQYIDLMTESDTDDARTSSISQLHLNMDAFPLSATKRAALKDLVSDPAVRCQFLYPSLLYHTRWSTLAAEDFAFAAGQGKVNPLLGCELRYNVEPVADAFEKERVTAGMEAPTVGVSYLIRMIETCQERGIGVLLTCLPLNAGETEERAANGAKLIADTYGVPFINWFDYRPPYTDSFYGPFAAVSPYADFHDPTHLNAMGASKVTFYLGDILTKEFALTDHRDDTAYAFWQERADANAAGRRTSKLNAPSLYAQLSLLSHGLTSIKPYNAPTDRKHLSDWKVALPDKDNIGCIVFLRFLSDATKDANLLHIMDALRGQIQWALPDHDDSLARLMSEKGIDPYLYLFDPLTGNSTECIGMEELTSLPTALGNLTYAPQSNYCSLVRDSAPDENLLNMTDEYNADVQVILFDAEGAILSHRCYYLNDTSYDAVSLR